MTIYFVGWKTFIDLQTHLLAKGKTSTILLIESIKSKRIDHRGKENFYLSGSL